MDEGAEKGVKWVTLAIYMLGLFLLADMSSILIHEFGHILNGVATGGKFDHIEFSVLGWSRAFLAPHGEPRAVSWGGVQWACTISLLGFLLCWAFRSRAVLFFLVLTIDAFASSGQYLMVGLFTGEGDGAHLAMMGVSKPILIIIGSALLLVVFPISGLAGPLLGLGRRRNPYWRTLLAVGSPVVLLSLAVFIYNMFIRPAQWQFWGAVCGGATGMAFLFSSWIHLAAPWFDRHEAGSRRQEISSARSGISLGVSILVGVLLSLIFPISKSTSVNEAIKDSDMERLAHLLKGVDMNNSALSDARGTTPLLSAVTMRRTNMVEYLISHGAYVDATNTYGRTPLHQASYLGDEHLARMLISSGADINAVSRSGTPLHTAVYSRGTHIVEYLVKAGADTTITDMRGCTPADLARLRGKQELIPYLEKTP